METHVLCICEGTNHARDTNRNGIYRGLGLLRVLITYQTLIIRFSKCVV